MIEIAAWAPAVVPLLAFGLDVAFGEPPVRLHPVVWMGQYLQWAGERIAPSVVVDAPPSRVTRHENASRIVERARIGLSETGGATTVRDARRQFRLGALAWLLGAAVTTSLAWGAQWTLGKLPVWLAVPLLALCLKPLFAWTMLRDLVAQVETALGHGLQAGREQLAHLVSRDVQQLDEAGVRESAIETLAENLSDSVVAPLLWFALLGLPGAALYRFANTADAMWGYPGAHGGRHWQWAGKWAARADDVLNWLPARLTAGLLMMGARRTLWQALPVQAALTPSPNGGWPMGAMALRLGVSLGKPGVYRLNGQAPAPQASHTWQALRRARRAAWLAVALCASTVALVGPWG
ncbi:adenosylcobinamide-phosphate synthase CbiB [Lautropia mirabilis]